MYYFKCQHVTKLTEQTWCLHLVELNSEKNIYFFI